MKMTEKEFIDYVRNYAIEHYDTNGWDFVIEAWTDSDIIARFENAGGNVKKAFKSIQKTVKDCFDYEQEIRNS
jgi:hypothetical protein